MADGTQQGGDGKPLPLAGIRVVDFGWVISVPLIGRFLADLGAQVIKVESRSRLDLSRREAPLGDRQAGPDWAVGFHGLHRNKLSVTLDLRSEEARALVKRLLTYSLGRSLEYSDRRMVDTLTRGFVDSDYRLGRLIVAIADSRPFLTK